MNHIFEQEDIAQFFLATSEAFHALNCGELYKKARKTFEIIQKMSSEEYEKYLNEVLENNGEDRLNSSLVYLDMCSISLISDNFLVEDASEETEGV